MREVTMKKTSILGELEKKDVNAEGMAERVIRNPDLVQELLGGITSANARIKFGSAKILKMISERNPQSLYSQMDFYVNLLDGDNAILKWTALDIIGNLTAVDLDNKFDSLLFRKYCDFLHEGSLITAAHVVDNLGKIAQAKPEFQDEITRTLLKAEEVSLPTEECRNILVGKIINAFNAYYDKTSDREKMIGFTRRHLNNSRNATRAKAARFLKKFETQ